MSFPDCLFVNLQFKDFSLQYLLGMARFLAYPEVFFWTTIGLVPYTAPTILIIFLVTRITVKKIISRGPFKKKHYFLVIILSLVIYYVMLVGFFYIPFDNIFYCKRLLK